jgi:hypothetical protein
MFFWTTGNDLRDCPTSLLRRPQSIYTFLPFQPQNELWCSESSPKVRRDQTIAMAITRQHREACRYSHAPKLQNPARSIATGICIIIKITMRQRLHRVFGGHTSWKDLTWRNEKQTGGYYGDKYENRLWEWEVNNLGSGTCPMVGFGIGSIEPSGSSSGESVAILAQGRQAAGLCYAVSCIDLSHDTINLDEPPLCKLFKFCYCLLI